MPAKNTKSVVVVKKFANEGELVKYNLLMLGKHFPDTVRAWRNNRGCMRVEGRFVEFGTPGQGDISGIIIGGIRLEIECKMPGEKQSKDQISFQKMIDNMGGIYIVSYSWEDVFKTLKAKIFEKWCEF